MSVEKLTKIIRLKYGELNDAENSYINLQCTITQLKKDIAELENERNSIENDECFIQLLKLFPKIMHHKERLKRTWCRHIKVFNSFYVFISTPVIGGTKIEYMHFGALLQLWDSDWVIDGNPVTGVWYHNGKTNVTYWDLKNEVFIIKTFFEDTKFRKALLNNKTSKDPYYEDLYKMPHLISCINRL